MEPQQHFNADAGGSVVCAQCGAPMPHGMRFCRSCGNRLGEGPAEYTETVRLADGQRTGPQFSNFGPGYTAPVAKQTGSDLSSKRKRRISGMAWVFIAIAFFFTFGAVMSLVKRTTTRNPPRISVNATRSFFGVDEFKDANGGATFDNVEPPGSPADKAGLVGGDIITAFDNHAVKDEDEIMELLRQTPIGKTVEVIYLRDGETKKTQLTTISQGEYNELERADSSRPEGRGMFGFESDRTTVISIPETKTYGLQLDYVEPNGPADLFGLKTGDIITEFGGVPIRTSGELLSRVRRAIPRSVVEVTILRDGQTMKIPVTMGRSRR